MQNRVLMVNREIPVWKEVYGYPRYWVCRDGRIFSRKHSKFLKPIKDKNNRLWVTLFKDKKGKLKSIHHCVLESFLEPRPEGKECNHKDGNPENNVLENLEWMSSSENLQHAYDNNIRILSPKVIKIFKEYNEKRKGTSFGRKLNSQKVKEIKQLRKEGMKYKDIGKMFNIHPEYASLVCKGKFWRNIDE